jgi:hypothetical protein
MTSRGIQDRKDVVSEKKRKAGLRNSSTMLGLRQQQQQQQQQIGLQLHMQKPGSQFFQARTESRAAFL